jgi:hypothetical protein
MGKSYGKCGENGRSEGNPMEMENPMESYANPMG